MITEALQKYLNEHHFPKTKIKAFFFDMDGVLFNSMPKHASAWHQAMKEYNIDFPHKETYLNEGQPGLETIRIAFEQQKQQTPTEEKCKEIYQRKGELFSQLGKPNTISYASEMIQFAVDKGLEVFVVTGSAHQDLLENLLKHFPLIKKENVVSALNLKRGKPYPDPYLKALELAGLQPYEAVVIENAPLGVRAGSTAQIFTIAVNTGPLDKEILLKNGANIVFDSMKSLFENRNQLNL